MEKISCAILAGGQSRRFGRDKTITTIGNMSLPEILSRKLSSVSDDVMVISKNPEKFNFTVKNVKFLSDLYESQSPLIGIITALKNAKYDKVFIISADTPFLNVNIINLLSKYTKNYDAVLTVVDGKINTLCGFYMKSGLPTFMEFYHKKHYRLIDIYDKINTFFIEEVNKIKQYDPHLLSFLNINTPEDYEYAKQIAEKFGIGI